MDFSDHIESKRKKEDIVNRISKLPINYVGNKRRLLPYIWDALEQNNIQFDSVFDAFSGSGIVSLLFKHMGKIVSCNDLLTSSALSSIALVENNGVMPSIDDMRFLWHNVPKMDDCNRFVRHNYKDKFFTEKECDFLDNYRENVGILYKGFYCGADCAGGKQWMKTSASSNGPSDNLRKSAFAMFFIENHINQFCFIGGRYYNGQTLAKLEHRLEHDRNKGQEINKSSATANMKKLKEAFVPGCARAYNSDIIDLLKGNTSCGKADLLYLDPPYGGNSSDYANLYRFLEEYLYGKKMEELEHIQKGSSRFISSKGYQEQFEYLLSLCSAFKIWMLSYNDSSFADLDTIKSVIKSAGRSNIIVFEVPITYQYRKNKNIVDAEHFKENYTEQGHKYLQRGMEYLILAMK